MTTRTRARVVLLAMTMVLSSSLLASAFHQDVRDPNDSRGYLDVKKVNTFGSKRHPGWRVVTFPTWTADQIWDKGYFMVLLDTFGSKRVDYFIQVSSYGTGMQARLWRDRENRRDREIGEVKSWRPNKRSIAVRLPLKRLRVRRTHYRWYVQTLWVADNCRRVCYDFAPDRRGVVEPLVRPTPTPTPTPSITLTPSPSPSSSPTP